MRKVLLIAMVVFSTTLIFSSCKTFNKNSNIKNYNDSISYALGVDYAAIAMMGIENTGQNYNYDLFVAGFEDFVKNNSMMDHNTAIDVLTNHFEKLKAESMDNTSNKSMQATSNDKNALYLEENAINEGVVTTSSGLQYRVIKEGSGKKPTMQDKVSVNYTGRLTNGNIFDSSIGRGEFSFTLNQVIPGWTEGIQLMSVGSIYEFTIPPHLGYGNQEIPDKVPANSILIFEVELLNITN
ncbi:FKBP-type peptidyl-prolyl cis-trans isomerase [Bacteroidales bacterium OttesenSCG-928-K22]|nr:FKBP-type peptidyl-prolyl cis-trans isomerase [Bacteroidales bacterium OttesenSCG-928-K22]